MKKHFFLWLLAAFTASPMISHSQTTICPGQMSWLKGTWKMQDKESEMVEEWNALASSLECKSYELKGRDSLMIETSTITCIGGKQVFTYHPVLKDANDTRKPVSFVLVSDDNNTFVFENKEHDFPQRVVYQRVNENECHAWIEGEEDGKTNRIDFNYKRVN
jgi:hypothetical protein